MPELPEVETVRKGLTKRLSNFLIQEIEVCRERVIASPGGVHEFRKRMKGKYIGEWSRRGKYLIASLSQEKLSNKRKQINRIEQINHAGWWVVHLRMTGQFQWHEKQVSICPHTRVRLWNSANHELRFVDLRSFGQMWWISPQTSPETIISGLNKLGPEPFGNDFTPNYLQQKIKGRKRSIKSALLDQTLIAGTGNIYADESLFDAGILPHKQSGELSIKEINRLCKSLVKILKESIGKGGTTFSDFRDLEGVNGNYGGQAWVYRRNEKPCRVCGTIIKKEKIAGRSSHWCPRCQR